MKPVQLSLSGPTSKQRNISEWSSPADALAAALVDAGKSDPAGKSFSHQQLIDLFMGTNLLKLLDSFDDLKGPGKTMSFDEVAKTIVARAHADLTSKNIDCGCDPTIVLKKAGIIAA